MTDPDPDRGYKGVYLFMLNMTSDHQRSDGQIGDVKLLKVLQKFAKVGTQLNFAATATPL